MKNLDFDYDDSIDDEFNEEREPLSGDDIENQDDWEVWQRFVVDKPFN